MERFILAASNLNVRGLSSVANPHLGQPHPSSLSTSRQDEEPQDLIVQNNPQKQIKRRRRSSGSSTSAAKTPKVEASSELEANRPDPEASSSPRSNTTEESFAPHVKVEVVQNEEELDVVGGVSPPRQQIENVPPPIATSAAAAAAVAAFSRSIFHQHFETQSPSRTRSPVAPTEPPRILPPNEPRKSGTCYFCKKAFMKNKQLMNHVCPKKPKIGGASNKNGSSSSSNGGNRAST